MFKYYTNIKVNTQSQPFYSQFQLAGDPQWNQRKLVEAMEFIFTDSKHLLKHGRHTIIII